jgi:hypothetical protein
MTHLTLSFSCLSITSLLLILSISEKLFLLHRLYPLCHLIVLYSFNYSSCMKNLYSDWLIISEQFSSLTYSKQKGSPKVENIEKVQIRVDWRCSIYPRKWKQIFFWPAHRKQTRKMDIRAKCDYDCLNHVLDQKKWVDIQEGVFFNTWLFISFFKIRKLFT